MATTEQFRNSHVPVVQDLRAATAADAASPACPLCGFAETETAFADSGCELRVCNFCELFFVYPYPASGGQHRRVAAGEYAEIELLDCERRYQGERHYYDRHFPLIAAEIDGATSILDVGCGTGHLLERLADHPGLFRAGIELNPLVARIARRAAQCEISEIPFEQYSGSRKFDVVTLMNVFSHIPSFDEMFRAMRSALAPGGKVLLRTSEMSRNVSRWNQIHWGIPDDLHFLGLGTLDFICAKYGFVVTQHTRTPYEEELFLRSRWQQMGRNPLLNLVKRAGVQIPGVLPLLRRLYTAILGRRLFVSFIVLRPIAGASPAFAERRN